MRPSPLRVLIADDEPIARQFLRHSLESNPEVEIVGESTDGPQTIHAIQHKAPDLVLLDVEMPGLDGFSVIRNLPPARRPLVIFASAHSSYGIQAFEAGALDYLLKPFGKSRLLAALDRARDAVARRTPARRPVARDVLSTLPPAASTRRQAVQRLAVKADGRVTFVRLQEIDWISSAGNYAELHAGKSTQLLHTTLGALEDRLPDNQFVRLSRSTLVNRDRIQQIHTRSHGDSLVVLNNGTQLTASRNYRNQLRQAIGLPEDARL